jgi:TetR/AcrR family transcriptional regulator, cholesterol catabolism regulator
LRAARRLFARKGFEQATTREIAEAADVGAGTLFLYTGKKEDLLVSIFAEDMRSVIDEALAMATAGGLLEQLLRVFGALIAHHEQDPGLARVFVKELPFVEDRHHLLGETMSTLLGGIARLVAQAQAAGELAATVQPADLADNLFALYFRQLQQWLGGGASSPERRDEALRAALALQLEGLRATGRRHARAAASRGGH